MVTLEEALIEATTPPENYWGSITDLCRQGWAQVASKHRDSDQLEISNYETMLKHYTEKYELNEDYRVEGSSHWLVGWTDCILVRALQCECEDWEDASFRLLAGNLWECESCYRGGTTLGMLRPIFIDAYDFACRLEDYPVLDEEDFSLREYEDMMEYLEQEVGEEYAHKLFEYLYETCSASRPDDVRYEWIEEWKKENIPDDAE